MMDYVAFAFDWLEAHGVPISVIKTLGYFTKVIERLIRDEYNGDISENEFVDAMADLVAGQLRRAWYEGMRENGWEPQDQRPEWESVLQTEITQEYNFVDRFAADVWEARVRDDEDNTPRQRLQGLYARGALWVNRYTEVVNLAVLTTAVKEDRLVWRFGKTEQHCETCATLNGWVATISEWEMSGWKPQSRQLECGGWHCDCRFETTNAESMGVPRV
jgi:hypothetical protein